MAGTAEPSKQLRPVVVRGKTEMVIRWGWRNGSVWIMPRLWHALRERAWRTARFRVADVYRLEVHRPSLLGRRGVLVFDMGSAEGLADNEFVAFVVEFPWRRETQVLRFVTAGPGRDYGWSEVAYR